jgi:hypothetical protein
MWDLRGSIHNWDQIACKASGHAICLRRQDDKGKWQEAAEVDEEAGCGEE